MVVVILKAPQNNEDADKMRELARLLLPLPNGVAQPTANVFLVDEASDIDFLLKAGKIAERIGLEIQAYSNVPKPPSV